MKTIIIIALLNVKMLNIHFDTGTNVLSVKSYNVTLLTLKFLFRVYDVIFANNSKQYW